jgi:3-methylcrotonyl-CoA carboxylase alpha subunit
VSALEIRYRDRTLVAHVGANATVRIDGVAFDVVSVGDGLYQVADGSRRWTVAVAGPADARWVFVDGQVALAEVNSLDRPSRREKSGQRSADHDLSSAMPATVVRVLVESGQRVSRGDTLVMLEAMKMELPIRAPRDGHVKNIACTRGELVQPGTPLVELEPVP